VTPFFLLVLISPLGSYRPLPHPRFAPTGSDRQCQGWEQEGALRMLTNNLDPEVAKNPDELTVYGGTGKAARIPRTGCPVS